ncbi:MAG: glycoside hydrolase family 44 protein [Kiritimatiellales bacterium]|nr:glycoside hydrolase family 44 protein [Kiritimatiellales bacterium]
MKRRKSRLLSSDCTWLFLLIIAGTGCYPELSRCDGKTPTAVCRIGAPSRARPIPSEIYGVAAAPKEALDDLRPTLNRWGGNPASRYNWQLGNAWNTGKDWFFMNVRVEDDAWRTFLRRSVEADSRVVITLPIIGNVAKDTTSYSYSIAKYGPQTAHAPGHADIGNGIGKDGNVVANDPRDASRTAPVEFVVDWVKTIKAEFPELVSREKISFALDNEPMLWHETHRDVHPRPISAEEYLERFVDYAAAIKNIAPEIPICGPEVWGWPAYFEAAQEREVREQRLFAGKPGPPFLPWFLRQLHQYEERTGQRLLNYVTVHYYPQARHVFSPRADAKTVALRLASSRALSDPTYRCPSWINARINLIPRLRKWVDEHYPGTKIGITEHNWGGQKHISGALALANALGTFGREGLDMACYWTFPDTESLARQAFKMFRNVDGKGARFGDFYLPSEWRRLPPALKHELNVYAAWSPDTSGVTLVIVNSTARDVVLEVETLSPVIRRVQGYALHDGGDGINRLPENALRQSTHAMTVNLRGCSIYHLRFLTETL